MTLVDPYHYYFGSNKPNPSAAELFCEIKYRKRKLPWPEFYQKQHTWVRRLVDRCLKFEPEERPDVEEIQNFVHEKVKEHIL